MIKCLESVLTNGERFGTEIKSHSGIANDVTQKSRKIVRNEKNYMRKINEC